MLVTVVGDEMRWVIWNELDWDFGDSFDHFGHKHPLSLNISDGNHQNNTTKTLILSLINHCRHFQMLKFVAKIPCHHLVVENCQLRDLNSSNLIDGEWSQLLCNLSGCILTSYSRWVIATAEIFALLKRVFISLLQLILVY